MPFSSSALTSVASLNCAGGWVNFCSVSSFTSVERLTLFQGGRSRLGIVLVVDVALLRRPPLRGLLVRLR